MQSEPALLPRVRCLECNVTDTFHICVNRVLAHEGGYVYHPDDPGGETNFGISKRAYPNLDIKTLTRSDAIAIYYADYWVPLGCHRLPRALAFQVFDAGVNHGQRRALEWLALADFAPSVAGKVLTFNKLRLEFYTGLKAFRSFGKGWTKRVVANLRYAAEDLDGQG